MRFDATVRPEVVHFMVIGAEQTLTIEDQTINATIVDINKNRVTYEVLGEEAALIEELFKPTPTSFSISSKGGV